MATTDPMEQIELDEQQVNERRDIVAKRILQRDKIDLQKSTQNKKWNEQLRLLDDQISTLGREIDTRLALVPARVLPGMEGPIAGDVIDTDDEADADDGDGVLHVSDMKPGKRGGKKAAKKKRASRPKNGSAAHAD